MSTIPAALLALSTTRDHLIVEHMVTDHVQPPVLGTPSLILLMEITCADATREYITDEFTSVGTKVCMTHEAGVYLGETLTIAARVTGVSGRRVSYEIEARVGDRLVSRCTHEQAVVRAPDPAVVIDAEATTAQFTGLDLTSRSSLRRPRGSAR